MKGRLSASNALLALIALLNLLSAATLAQPANLPPALVYDTLTHGPVPIPPGEKHWHGATTTGHVAVQEKLDGKNVDWMEKVTDEQFPR